MKYTTLFLAELGALCFPFVLFFLDAYAKALPKEIVPYLLLVSVVYLVCITIYAWYTLLTRKNPVPPPEEAAKRVARTLAGFNTLFSAIMVALFLVGFLR